MERIHIDYVGPFKGHYYCVIVDADSKWSKVLRVSSIMSKITINCLEGFIKQIIVSDNATQFRAGEFTCFCEANGILQKFSTPFHPSTKFKQSGIFEPFKHRLNRLLSRRQKRH